MRELWAGRALLTYWIIFCLCGLRISFGKEALLVTVCSMEMVIKSQICKIKKMIKCFHVFTFSCLIENAFMIDEGLF